MKISVFYDHVQKACAARKLAMPTMLRYLHEWSVDGVYIELNTLLKNETAILQELHDADLSICGIYNTFNWSNGFSKEEAEAIVDAAVRCNTDNILIVPGFLSKEQADSLRSLQDEKDIAAFMEQNDAIQNIRTGLQYTANYASNKNVAVTLEDYDGHTAPFSRMAELKWWMEQVSGLQFTLDTGNFAFSDEDTLAACKQFRKNTVHVHCKDRAADPNAVPGVYNRGLLPCAVGDGYLPMAEIITYLKETSYTGGLTIEHFGAANFFETIHRSADYLHRKHLFNLL